MRRSKAVVLVIVAVLFASVSSAQQTSFKASTSNYVVSVEQDGSGAALTLQVPGRSNLLISGSVAGLQKVLTVDAVGNMNLLSSVNTGSGYQIGGNYVLQTSASDSNTFVGEGAGADTSPSPTSGDLNTFVGQIAGSSNSTGEANTVLGNSAAFFATSGSNNTVVGTFAGYNLGPAKSGGSNNVFVGFGAGVGNASGDSNIFIGDSAGESNTSGHSNVYISSLGNPTCQENDTIRIGLEGQSSDCGHVGTYIANILKSKISGVPVLIGTTGQLGVEGSSLLFKEQVRDMGDSTDALMKLRPVTFLYKPEYADGERTLQYGLIAEEVAKVYRELVAYDKDGQPYAVRYQYLSTMLLNEVQKQYRRAEAEAEVVKAQEQKIDSQQREIESLRQQVHLQNATLQQRLSRLEALVGARVNTAQIEPDRGKARSGGAQ